MAARYYVVSRDNGYDRQEGAFAERSDAVAKVESIAKKAFGPNWEACRNRTNPTFYREANTFAGFGFKVFIIKGEGA